MTRATKLGVRPIESADELFLAAPLLLYMTAEPLEYPRSDWPESVRMVGPCSWDPPADPPAWLAEIDKPIVLVSTSSEFQDDGKLVTTALEALATEDVQVVATLPSAEVPASVPANARVETFVPHAPILERAACAITHGGAGVTMKALAAGVPVLRRSRSAAISPRSPAASRSRARARKWRPRSSARSDCAMPCAKR